MNPLQLRSITNVIKHTGFSVSCPSDILYSHPEGLSVTVGIFSAVHVCRVQYHLLTSFPAYLLSSKSKSLPSLVPWFYTFLVWLCVSNHYSSWWKEPLKLHTNHCWSSLSWLSCVVCETYPAKDGDTTVNFSPLFWEQYMDASGKFISL